MLLSAEEEEEEEEEMTLKGCWLSSSSPPPAVDCGWAEVTWSLEDSVVEVMVPTKEDITNTAHAL